MHSNTKPLQTIPYRDKIKDDNAWGKENVDYFIGLAVADTLPKDGVSIETLYEVYNGRFPNAWFKNVTDPLSAQDPNNTYYPAKIRPVTILRTNIDLLQGEFIKRPFPFQVQNLSAEAYYSYEEEQLAALRENLINHFKQGQLQGMLQQGIAPEEAEAQLAEVEPPAALMERFPIDYRDYVAQMGKDFLDNALYENRIRDVWKDLFKDWLISGHTYSYKSVFHDKMVYWRVSPTQVKHDDSSMSKYLEDRDWVVVDYTMSLSELVDLFYDELTEETVKKLESMNVLNRSQFMNFLSTRSNSNLRGDKYVVRHAVWKSKKRLAEVTYTDPITGELISEVHDEEYVKRSGEKVSYFYVNEFWEGWKIADEFYVNIRPIPVQRNELNNLSSCKGPYNGSIFSNTESDYTSVLKLGIPIQILYLIVQYKLEEAIAQNMGKIVIIDRNVIPKGEGWNDEKFFYTARSKRFMVINRNQMGVDKSFNQYQVLDMDTFQNIAQLIDILNALEEKWDNLIGISRQRKSQVMASDTVAGSQAAIFQSSVITEVIFESFREFLLTELQGMLDLSKFANLEGARKLWHTPDMKARLLEIDPELYANASLQVFATDTPGDTDKLTRIRSYLQAFAQNGMDPAAVIELEVADSIAELKQLGRKYSDTAKALAQQTEENKVAAEEKIRNIERETEAFLKSLDLDYMHQEYDRKERLEIIKNEGKSVMGTGQDPNYDTEREAMQIESDIKTKELAEAQRGKDMDVALKTRELDIKEKEIESKERIENKKAMVALKNKVSGER